MYMLLGFLLFLFFSSSFSVTNSNDLTSVGNNSKPPKVCKKNGRILFRVNGCDDSPHDFAAHVKFDHCYKTSYKCKGPKHIVACNGVDWSSCLSLGNCTDTGSFKIQNGSFYSYPYNKDCTGMEFKSEGCMYDMLTIGNYRQIDAREAVYESIC